jgi:peptidoglycan hydrolase-like protein with peptidoglycan-binding domain
MPRKQTPLERSHNTLKTRWSHLRGDGPPPVSEQIGGAGASDGRGWRMRRPVWRAGLAAIAVSLGTLSADGVAGDHIRNLAQNASDAPARAAPVAGAPTSVPANSPELIRRAQTELRRLDCLKGRTDGKLGNQTKEAVKAFWAMAKQPAASVDITDELISNLAERGDNFCRPPRRFFGFGGRALPPLFAPGARPGFGPSVRPPSPDQTTGQ